MKVLLHNILGTMLVEESKQLHYIEDGAVRKFYQVMLVSFLPDGPGEPIFWTIFNWGARTEAGPNQDLKGQFQSGEHKSRQMAIEANDRQIKVKERGGYKLITWSQGVYNPPEKILIELGASMRSATTIQAGSIKLNLPPATVEREPLMKIQSEINRLAGLTLTALATGDIGQAVPARQELLDLINNLQSLQEMAAGQLEVLNAKLFAGLR